MSIREDAQSIKGIMKMSPVPKSVSIKKLEDTCTQKGWVLLTPYVASKIKVRVRCERGHEFESTPTNIANKGNGCPCCSTRTFNENKSAVFYCVRWEKDNKSFLKFGVTNTLSHLTRIAQQSKKTDYLPTDVITSRYFMFGGVPKGIERSLHDNLKTSYVDKVTFGDGYTETVEDTKENEAFIKEMVWG